MQLNTKFSFFLHLSVIKRHYCELKRVKPSLNQVAKPLNVNILDMQKSMFKFVVKAQATKAMAKPFDMNLVTKLWVTITDN
jgi:hypothetical protein